LCIQKYDLFQFLLFCPKILDIQKEYINPVFRKEVMWSGPPKYWRGMGNAFRAPPQLHLLVVGDEQHLWMANLALETE
jgi:hypothetical protein